MKRYIIISYDGANLSASEVMAIASQLNTVKPDVTDVHASTMDEEEVSSIIIRHAEAKNATELSVVESACIYVKKRFGKFFGSKMKLLLALSEAITNEPNNESLMNAIKVISGGISKRMRDSYGVSTDVIYVFKTVQDNM
ncbi:hypothetical protein [Catenibacterium sp.]|uniref:hypothetical protein n=1 Tax=Catenibacterium sp. TaxID=2049022 RepID=UPI002E77D0EE|nr:hypothetical protein [Catenibacterium sp.]MEE0041710.1 hypothetical protein [Catenibacterium sp.]